MKNVVVESSRKIIHVDMDCFYAAVEIRDDPSLKGKPVAVGGRPDQRGVLTTASYEARKYGLRSAMPSARAVKLCPDLILLPLNFDKYRAESQKVRAIFHRFTEVVEPLSLDEAYLDVTKSEYFDGSATKIAAEIRRQIFEETRLTASAGIAPNKFLAKVASDWKKPNGQFTIAPAMVEQFVKGLKVEKIPGVGKVTARKMHDSNIFTCADLQALSFTQLKKEFGVWGARLYDLCRGIDERPVEVDAERKSISVEYTYNQDLRTVQECLDKLPELYDDFVARIQKYKAGESIRSLFVKIKFFDFKQTTLESSRTRIPSLETFREMIAAAVKRQNKAVRLIGIGARLATPHEADRSEDDTQLTFAIDVSESTR